MIRFFRFASPVLWYIFSVSCFPKIHPYSGEKAFVAESGRPDYNKLEYWASHPDKWDPADSIPRPLKRFPRDSSVGVFFVHPTTYTEKEFSAIPNASIDDARLNSKTDFTSILYQASVFNVNGNIYAPRYRQAHINMYYEKDTAKALKAFDTAYFDVRSAFLYFLEKNRDKPIVIASHSQGTTHTKRLLKEFFDGKPLSNRLVVAYLVGIRVEKGFFKELRVCKDSLSTGCITSWRTYREGYEGSYTSKNDSETVVVNPITWIPQKSFADRSLHKGAVLYSFNKAFTRTHSAQIVGDMVWISKPRFPGSFLYNTKNYHAGDINLFYLDIRSDVYRRSAMFLADRK
jgi:hypothetical protein